MSAGGEMAASVKTIKAVKNVTSGLMLGLTDGCLILRMETARQFKVSTHHI